MPGVDDLHLPPAPAYSIFPFAGSWWATPTGKGFSSATNTGWSAIHAASFMVSNHIKRLMGESTIITVLDAAPEEDPDA